MVRRFLQFSYQPYSTPSATNGRLLGFLLFQRSDSLPYRPMNAAFHRQRPGKWIGWCALFDRSAWSVPACCPEPYLYDRLFSGSEIAVGVEAASAKLVVGANQLRLLIMYGSTKRVQSL